MRFSKKTNIEKNQLRKYYFLKNTIFFEIKENSVFQKILFSKSKKSHLKMFDFFENRIFWFLWWRKTLENHCIFFTYGHKMWSHCLVCKYFFVIPKTDESYDRCASKTSKHIAIGSKLAEIDPKNLGVSNELCITVYHGIQWAVET